MNDSSDHFTKMQEAMQTAASAQADLVASISAALAADATTALLPPDVRERIAAQGAQIAQMGLLVTPPGPSPIPEEEANA